MASSLTGDSTSPSMEESLVVSYGQWASYSEAEFANECNNCTASFPDDEDTESAATDCALMPLERGVEVELEAYEDVANSLPVEVIYTEEGILAVLHDIDDSICRVAKSPKEEVEVALEDHNAMVGCNNQAPAEYDESVEIHWQQDNDDEHLDPVWDSQRQISTPRRRRYASLSPQRKKWWSTLVRKQSFQTAQTTRTNSTSSSCSVSAHDECPIMEVDENNDEDSNVVSSTIPADSATIVNDLEPLFRVSEIA